MTLRTIAQKDYHDLIVTSISFAVIEFFHRIYLTRDISKYSYYSICVSFSDERIHCFEYSER